MFVHASADVDVLLTWSVLLRLPAMMVMHGRFMRGLYGQ
jgi:hypothetical protein